MLSELFRIPVEAGGVPVLGVGVLLALWLLGFGAVMAWRAARHGADGEFWGYAQPAVIGAVVLAFAPRFAPQGIPIRGYGVMLLAAISVAVAMAVHRARRHGVSPDTMFAMVFWLFVAGIAGARAFFVIEYWEERFAGGSFFQTLWAVLQFTEGGLVVYGSLFGGMAAFAWFALRHKLPLLGMADILAPCVAVGFAIGRLGCLLNGCCYGGTCDLPWAVTFPVDSPPFMDHLAHGALHGMKVEEDPKGLVIVEGSERRAVDEINGAKVEKLGEAAAALSEAYAYGKPVSVQLASGETLERPASPYTRSLPVHPAQLYDTVSGGLIAWLLWSWFPHRRRDGEVALLLLTIYPVCRFLLEIIRTDETSFFGTGMSISQNISLGMLLLAVVGWLVLTRTPPGRRWEEVPELAGQPPRTAAAGAA